MARELVTFAANCELSDMDLLVSQHNENGVAARIAVYWADVLTVAGTPPKEWCGAFALWCIHAAELGPDLHWEIGKGFLFCLPLTKAPEPGDVAYLAEPLQHHAIVVEVDGDTVHTINGNQGPEHPIKEASSPLSHWTAFDPIPPLLPPEASA